MFKYIIKRIGLAIVTIWAVATITFSRHGLNLVSTFRLISLSGPASLLCVVPVTLMLHVMVG